MRLISSVLGCVIIVACAARGADQSQPPRRGPGEGVPPLPQAITSFGAAVDGDWLYVYGGHIGRAHAHSAQNHSDGFYRLNLKTGAAWEPLEMGTHLQGLAVVSHGGSIYRVGGLSMRNPSGEPEDMHSVDEFARYDTDSGRWEKLPSLPGGGRSSHDAAVLDGKLYVVGGWKLAGDSDSGVWAEHGYVADLAAPAAPAVRWEKLPPQPFKHRALAVAATTKSLYAIGGLSEEGKPTGDVFIFDPASRNWSKGPELPTGTRAKAFAVSAFGVGDTVWASGIDGRVYSLRDGASAWVDTGYDLKTPRFFHRLLPHGERLLFIAGASKASHLDSVEMVEIATLRATPTAALPAATPSTVTHSNSSQAGSTTWPGFRGSGDSHTAARDLPIEWSDEENIAWRADLPGYGQSSPVIWGDKVFVTSIEGAKQERLHVTCVDLRTGKQLWTRSFPASQTVSNTGFVSKAAPTPAVDARRLYAFFESGELIALDHAGQTLWQRSLTKEYGEFKGNHGLGASIALADDSVIVLADHSGSSYLLSADAATGENRWKVEREPRVSWSSPVITGQEILISSNGVAESYSAADGKLLWRVEELKGNTVASPSAEGELVVIGSSERGSCVAIDRRDGKVRWRADGALASFASPLIHRGGVYYVNKPGVASCVDLQTGRELWALRLPSSCWASPIAAGDLVYYFCTAGQAVVLRPTGGGGNGEQPVKVAESKLDIDGGRVYGVAAVDGAFVLRTGTQLIRIGLP